MEALGCRKLAPTRQHKTIASQNHPTSANMRIGKWKQPLLADATPLEQRDGWSRSKLHAERNTHFPNSKRRDLNFQVPPLRFTDVGSACPARSVNFMLYCSSRPGWTELAWPKPLPSLDRCWPVTTLFVGLQGALPQIRLLAEKPLRLPGCRR